MSDSQMSSVPSSQEVILEMASGHLVSCAIRAAAHFAVADHLSNGPKQIDELAAATGTHPQSLHRLLRMLAGHGVFRESAPGYFELTVLAEPLQSGVPGSVRSRLGLIGEFPWNSLGQLAYTIRTGKPGFPAVYGSGLYEYFEKNPAHGSEFNRGMAAVSSRENSTIVSNYDFGHFRQVIDVGGGQGGFVAEVLKAYPSVMGVLYDQPSVVGDPAQVNASGMQDRCEIIGGNFFESVPSGGDCYVIKRVLWDWNDETSIALLRRCQKAMTENGRVLVMDLVMPTGNEPHPIKDVDLIMMVLEEGRARTEEEYRSLYQRAGLRVIRFVPTGTPEITIVEGARA